MAGTGTEWSSVVGFGFNGAETTGYAAKTLLIRLQVSGEKYDNVCYCYYHK
jgi:hypothetical protein